MKKHYISIVLLLVLCAVFAYGISRVTDTDTIKYDTQVRNLSVAPGDLVRSPLVVSGEARGNWFFEANLPVRLTDDAGREIAVAPAQAEGEWMTSDFVAFKTTIAFDARQASSGFLIIQKDNPSGLPEHAGEVSVPVRFK